MYTARDVKKLTDECKKLWIKLAVEKDSKLIDKYIDKCAKNGDYSLTVEYPALYTTAEKGRKELIDKYRENGFEVEEDHYIRYDNGYIHGLIISWGKENE